MDIIPALWPCEKIGFGVSAKNDEIEEIRNRQIKQRAILLRPGEENAEAADSVPSEWA